MADKVTQTGVATKAKGKAKVQYEMVVDETGALVRRPIGAPPPPPPPSAPTSFRPAIATAAVVASRGPVEEEELVFDESGEELTGEAKAKAQAEALAKLQEEELVFDESGEELTGDARARAQEQAEPQLRAEAEAKPKAKSRREKQNATTFNEVNDKEKVKIFFRYKQKYPQFFVYTAEGNLEIKANNPVSLPPTVLTMRAFSALEPEELKEIEDTQKEMVKEDNDKYVVLLNELRTANEAYNPGDPETLSKIVRLNEQLREITVSKTSLLYPERWISNVENPTIKDILLDQTHEERKMGYDIYMFKRYSLSRQDVEGHYREHGRFRPGGMEGGNTVVLFLTNTEDQQTGLFHPATEKEFVYNETKYASPYQAYEVERFKEVEDDIMVKKLLGTRSAKTIRNLVSQEKTQPPNPTQRWEEILEAFYTQSPDLAKKLKETGSARFHMMDKLIGMPEYAVALANVRTKLKERENDAPANVDAVKQSVITKDEQSKAKVGAIINNFRR